MTRRMYAGGAVETTITGSIASSGAVTVTIASAAGWPDAVSGPFAVVVDPGSASEEKMLVTARSGTNLTVESGNRGYDGTSAIAHTSGGVIYLTLTAVDLDEANSHVNATASAHAASAIANTPAGSIAATTVQNAINELDTEKAAASHTQASSTITDFAEAVQDVVGAMFTDGTGIDSTYNDGAGTLTVTVDPSEFAAATSVELTRASNQSITTGVLTAISWDTEVAATDWIAVPNATLTVPAGAGGWYILRSQVIMASGTVRGQLCVGQTGSVTATWMVTSPVDLADIVAAPTGALLLKLVAADTITVYFNHITGSNRNITASLDLIKVSN